MCRLRSPQLVKAFAMVPREQFLGPGPWMVVSENPYMAAGTSFGRLVSVSARLRTRIRAASTTTSPSRSIRRGSCSTASPAHSRSGSIRSISRPARACSTSAPASATTPRSCAQCVGPSGRVVAFEIDADLAAAAARNLAPLPWVDRRAAATRRRWLSETFDAILVNAGVTHPLDAWLDALAPGGRMILPITAAMPAMGSTLGKGLVFLLTRTDDTIGARVMTMVAVYSAIGLRDRAAQRPTSGRR